MNKCNDFDYNNEHYNPIRHTAVPVGGAKDRDITSYNVA